LAAYIKNEFAGVFCLHAYANAGHLKLIKLAQEDD
jgi:hypothetical protein